MDYRTLQAKLKEYKDQGLTAIRLNSPADELQTELERIEATQHEDGLAGDSTGNYLATAPAIYTEWTPFLQVGDIVQVPFHQTITITGREEKEHFIEYRTDAQSGNDEVFRVTYKAQHFEVVEETPESIAQEYIHSLYEDVGVSLSQIQVKVVSIEEENTVINFRVYDSEWTTLQVPRMMWDNFVMNRSNNIFEQELEQQLAYSAENDLRECLADFPEVEHGNISVNPFGDASVTIRCEEQFNYEVSGSGTEWFVARSSSYSYEPTIYGSAHAAIYCCWMKWQQEKRATEKLANTFASEDYWEKQARAKSLICG